jgi:nicotinamide phosphoribosyltransferase
MTNAMLLIDFYKACHDLMLPPKMTKSVSYFTPRMSRVDRWQHVVMFGLQGFCKTYLIDYFNKAFFNRPCDEVIVEYKRIMDNCFGPESYKLDKIRDLHTLGYLPIEIFALPEGEMVPMHVPMFGITNTHPDFAWLPQALESLISAEMWHPMIAATVGHTYRGIVNHWYSLTCENNIPRARAIGNFDFRGEECLQSAVKAGAGWCLSFLNTATVPTIPYLEENYNCDCTKAPVAFGSPSTEHAVMCSNYAIDGDEETLLRRLLTEIYPNTSFSAVLDSYDYWNVVENILPKLKTEILNHNGTFLVRGDSGDCVDVVTKTVFKLWDIFGGTVNSKGYKVLNPHVKAIYGDSITVQRANEIYRRLESKGFASCNVALGAGSFSFQCIEEDGELKPFTRDTFSSCIKATYCEIDGEPYPIFKNPKDGGFKKSQKGCCFVSKNDFGEYVYQDECNFNEAHRNATYQNSLITVFKDGKMVKEYTLDEIRNTLNKGAF